MNRSLKITLPILAGLLLGLIFPETASAPFRAVFSGGVFWLAAALYFLPTLIAWNADHPQLRAIAVLNVCMIITALGWMPAPIFWWVALMGWCVLERPHPPNVGPMVG